MREITPEAGITEREDGSLVYELALPFGNGAYVAQFNESAAIELKGQLEEFLKLIEEKRSLEDLLRSEPAGA